MRDVFRPDLLRGQGVVVTGGASGIGAATARAFAQLGADVVIASRKAESIAAAAAGLTEEVGRPVHGIACDIRDRDAVAALAAFALERVGRIDVLVNNGGGQFFSPAEAISPRGWDAVITTNLTGTWNLTRAVADAWMLAHGGSIVNVTMMTQGGSPGMAHSAAARSGVESLTRTLAIEWATRGVRVNCVAPGYVASSGLKRYPPELGIADRVRSLTPMKRLATTDEIAGWIVALASPLGAYVTGQVITVDGGASHWGDLWPIPDPAAFPPLELSEEPWDT